MEQWGFSYFIAPIVDLLKSKCLAFQVIDSVWPHYFISGAKRRICKIYKCTSIQIKRIQIWKYTSKCERQIKIYHVLNISRAALLLMRGPLILTFLDVPASQQCNNSDWANLLLQLTRKENLSCCGPLLRTFLFQFDFRKTLNQFINSMCKTAK